MIKEFGEIKINPSTIEDLANEFTDEFAIINEIIANAYDASATKFKIILNKDNKEIYFIDNGIGMNKQTGTDGFLHISNNKREKKEYKNSSRLIMGRKGSGRIGLFNLCQKIIVHSKTINDDPIAFYFNVNDILNNKTIIEELSFDDAYTSDYQSGTKIIIKDFSIQNIFNKIVDLKYIIYENFFPVLTQNKKETDKRKMYIEIITIENNEEVTEIAEPKDNVFENLDRFLNISGFEDKENEVKKAILKKDKNAAYGYDPNSENSKNERVMTLTETNLSLSKKCRAKTKKNDFIEKNLTITKGWIGTLSSIADSNDKKNYCVKIYSRNRLVIRDIRADFKIDRFYLNYIVGDIFVDDLDDDNLKDITKISRNAYGTQDDRYRTVIKLTKAMGQKLIAEKSNIAKKNKKIVDTENTKTMKEFLHSAQQSFNLNNETFTKFEEKAVKKFKVKTHNDKKIIFISHKAIHQKTENCDPNNLNEKLCYNSFLIGVTLTTIFEKIKEIKKSELNDNNFKIIFSSMGKYSMPLGSNIHQWLRKEGFNINYYENTIFYACIACTYINNWNTDIEYGASWFSQENATICLVDPIIETNSLKAPINSENMWQEVISLSIDDKDNILLNTDALLNDYEEFKKVFIQPLNIIGIDFSEEDYNQYIKNDLEKINENIKKYFKKEYTKQIKKINYKMTNNPNNSTISEEQIKNLLN